MQVMATQGYVAKVRSLRAQINGSSELPNVEANASSTGAEADMKGPSLATQSLKGVADEGDLDD